MGVWVNKLHPAAAHNSSSLVHVDGSTLSGNVNVPAEFLAKSMRRFQIGGRSKSMAMTLAPKANNTKSGPMADPAPSKTKYWFETF